MNKATLNQIIDLIKFNKSVTEIIFDNNYIFYKMDKSYICEKEEIFRDGKAQITEVSNTNNIGTFIREVLTHFEKSGEAKWLYLHLNIFNRYKNQKNAINCAGNLIISKLDKYKFDIRDTVVSKSKLISILEDKVRHYYDFYGQYLNATQIENEKLKAMINFRKEVEKWL